MDQYTNNEAADNNGEVSIFDDLKPLPVYFSERAVYVFSVLLGVFFGAVLMAVNFKNTEGKKGIWQVLVFGSVFTIIELWILSFIPAANSGITLGINLGGGYALRKFFWGKYIGVNVAYTKRSVLVPSIIAIVLVALIIVLIFLGGAMG